MNAPSDEFQLRFLDRLQRLLDESAYQSTYKLALLISLTRIAIEKAAAIGATLPVTRRELADQFVRIYWRHAAPYVAVTAGGSEVVGPVTGVLQQNIGNQAVIIRLLVAARATFPTEPAMRRNSREWNRLLDAIAATILEQPVTYLNTPDPGFLFRRVDASPRKRGEDGAAIELDPSIVFCLKRFQILLYRLAETEWLRFLPSVKGNERLIGGHDLREFLFGVDRATLGKAEIALRQIQGNECFYCLGPVGESCEVDHFIPWSRYALDLGHNFVLSCSACNNNKRDRLAAYEHLVRWCSRNHDHVDALVQAFEHEGVRYDLEASKHIARWAYEQAEAAGAQLWLRRKDVMVHVDQRWRNSLGI